MVEAAAVEVWVARPAVVQVAVLAGMAETVVTVARQQSLSGRRARVAEAAVADKRAPCTAPAVAVVALAYMAKGTVASVALRLKGATLASAARVAEAAPWAHLAEPVAQAACMAAAVVHLTSQAAHSQAPKAPFVSSGEPVARSPSTQANLDLGARYADDKLNSSARLDHFFHRTVLDRLGDVLKPQTLARSRTGLATMGLLYLPSAGS